MPWSGWSLSVTIRDPMCRYVGQSLGRVMPFCVPDETATSAARVKLIAMATMNTFFMDSLLDVGLERTAYKPLSAVSSSLPSHDALSSSALCEFSHRSGEYED